MKDRAAFLKSNPPPAQAPGNPMSRRVTTNISISKPVENPSASAPPPSVTTASTRPQRSTVMDVNFLNKAAEKPESQIQTGPAKRVSKLNPNLLGAVNIGALGPGGPRPPFAMPGMGRPSRAATDEGMTKRSDTSSASGELVHTTLSRPRVGSGLTSRRSMPHNRTSRSLTLNEAGDSYILVEKINSGSEISRDRAVSAGAGLQCISEVKSEEPLPDSKDSASGKKKDEKEASDKNASEQDSKEEEIKADTTSPDESSQSNEGDARTITAPIIEEKPEKLNVEEEEEEFVMV